ncbi:hypothetical protein BV20DRAFT_998803 [Pilatotrama ljubarskyi]|nr:hypothetical protein BV20DRAFT_998803 [Pilatotrama ljubarskyi]
MPMRYAQRKHIIRSLNSLLYQLFTISFLLSPRLWSYFCRLLVQIQFVRPREIDAQRSLRFWFICILGNNAPALYNHIVKSPATGRSIILDFVGNDGEPTRALLLFLDFIIIFLQVIITTIAFETSLARDLPPDTPDPLQPEPIPSTPISPLPLDGANAKPTDSTLHEEETEYIIDLRLRTILQRLRHPPPVPPPQPTRLSDDLLPLPNTTAFQLSQSIRTLARATARGRERAGAARSGESGQNGSRRGQRARGSDRSEREEPPEETRRVPGGMASDDEM